jgi:Tfp pilus assembly protein PilO
VKSFTKKITIELLLSVGVIILFGIGLWVSFGDLKSVGLQIISSRSSSSAKEQSFANLANLKQESVLAREKMNILRSTFPSREGILSFRDHANLLAKQWGVSSNFNFSSEHTSKDNNPDSIEFSLAVSGNYDNVISFIEQLEKGRYYISINKMDIVAQGSNTSAYQAVIGGEVFFK